MTVKTLSIAGPGRVGTHLGALLARSDWVIEQIAGRSLERADAARALISDSTRSVRLEAMKPVDGVLLLTVSDTAIRPVCDLLVDQGVIKSATAVLHTSGLCTSEELISAQRAGASIASLHPLQTFARPSEGIDEIVGTHWFFEGDVAAKRIAQRICQDLGGSFHEIETGAKALYHASASIACNFLNTIFDIALCCSDEAGIQRSDMQDALQPLVLSTVRNIFRSDAAASLTGPISRGDVETLSNHLSALQSRPDLVSIYRVLASQTIDLAVKGGHIDETMANQLKARVKDS